MFILCSRCTIKRSTSGCAGNSQYFPRSLHGFRRERQDGFEKGMNAWKGTGAGRGKEEGGKGKNPEGNMAKEWGRV